MYGTERAGLTEREVFARLKELGAAKALVSFEGGNDDGGVTGIILVDDKSEKIGEVNDHYQEPALNDDGTNKLVERTNRAGYTYKTVEYKPLPEEQEKENALYNTLGAPVYDRFGSFAGEFEVHGIVEWDVENEEVDMRGEQSAWEPLD